MRRGRPPGADDAQVLAVAREAFLAHGFRGATMDAVAAGAHISKQSLYRAYPSKDALFAAVVRDWVQQGHDAMRPHVATLVETPDVRTGLLQLAAVLQAGILGRPVLAMRSLVAAEAERFPAVAAEYLERSWARNLSVLADGLATLAERGLLHVDDPALAAEQLTWLVIAAPLNRLTLQAGADPYEPDELALIAEQGVTTFLSRFAH
jgi:TetR/AcrR family transcriptional regulator, mexJK operon transcriptional repressor